VGGIIGLILSFLATRALQGFLFGIETLDPVAFLAVPALFAGVSFIAAYIPARKASRIDPARSLNAE
jgi:ABC-type antimicrobial peptide transport system permease subunit